jgi:hypothetical protein
MTLRVRALDANGDYRFGGGASEFLVDSPAAVQQKLKTRLLLFQGEWFLDSAAGTPWFQQILGRHASGPPRGTERNVGQIYDIALKTVLSNTRGVSQILKYSSTFNSSTRSLNVTATILTIFSTTPIEFIQSVPVAPVVPSIQLG